MLQVNIVDRKDNVLVFQLTGRLTFEETANLRNDIRDAHVKMPAAICLFDMTNLDLIDSSGLGLLVAARNSFERSDGRVILCGVGGRVKTVMTQTNLITYFRVFDTEEAAAKFYHESV